MLKVGDKIYYRSGYDNSPKYIGEIVRTTKTLAIMKNIYGNEIKLRNKESYGGYFEIGRKIRNTNIKYYILTPEVEREIGYHEARNLLIKRILYYTGKDSIHFLRSISDKALYGIYEIIKEEFEQDKKG